MRIVNKFRSENDEFFHPLWLGIIILFCVIFIISISCCLRRKCGLQLRNSFNRLFGTNNKKNGNSSSDDAYSSISYSHNWPSIYRPTRSSSPKLYTLVRNIKIAKLEKQLSLKQQNSNEDANECEVHSAVESDRPQISVLSAIDSRTSEVARKFYASMRNNSQCRNSSSVDSSNNDASLTSRRSSLTTDKAKCEENIRLFRTPCFFQSIPNADGLSINLN